MADRSNQTLRRKTPAPIAIVPSEKELKRFRALVSLPPMDLRQLVAEAHANGTTPDKLYAARRDIHLSLILKILNVNQDSEESWKEGFLKLAMATLGAGRVEYVEKKQQENAKRWNNEAEDSLFWYVQWRLAAGRSERAAIEDLSKDKAAVAMLPISARGYEQHRGKIEQQKRANALWTQWMRAKKRSPERFERMSLFWESGPLGRRFLELELGPEVLKLFGYKR